jgi:hypothetical protein
LVAIAPSVVDAVRFTGGWLFDQVMAGWDVNVLTTDNTDPRPMRIFGAHAVDLEYALARVIHGPCLQAIAVSADLYDADDRVRRMVQTLGEGPADIRFWSDRWPESVGGRADPVRHRLSVAARAFKAQALSAAAIPVDADEVTEVFWRAELMRSSQVAAR